MPDLTALGAALTSLKAAKDIAETMIGLRDTALLQQKQIEFQSKIIDATNAAFAAQEERAAMLDKIRDFEEQIAKFEAWEAQKKRYQLTDFGGGTFAYLLKPEMANGEPQHRACAPCFENGKRSILQFRGRNFFSQDQYTCPECQTAFEFGVIREAGPL